MTDKDAVTETKSDHLDAYVATFDDEERDALAAAEAAIDIAILLHRARERRGLSQAAAAGLAGLQQQTVSRFERPAANPRLETIQEYLGALGYGVEIRAIDLETGEAAAKAVLPRPRPRRPVRTPAIGPPRRARRPDHRAPQADAAPTP